jgi:hypothetical protein
VHETNKNVCQFHPFLFRYMVPTKGELKVAVHAMANESRAKLKDIFKENGPVSITMDCWSRYTLNKSTWSDLILCTCRHDRKCFVGMTAHWIDGDMKLCCAALRCNALEVVLSHDWEVPRETAANVTKFVKDTLDLYCVDQYSLTTDAPTVMEAVRGNFKNGYRCLCHVLHQVCWLHVIWA